MTTPTTTAVTGATPERVAGLRRWNLGLAVLHAAQAALILVMASDFAITITTTYPQGPPGTRLSTPEELFNVPIGPASVGLADLRWITRHLSSSDAWQITSLATHATYYDRAIVRGLATNRCGSARLAPRACA